MMFSPIPIIKPVAAPYTQQKKIKKHEIHSFWVKTNPDELQSRLNPSLPLEEEEVYIFINPKLRKIFLWVGKTAPARSKFIGAHAANIIQRRTGIVYRVETVDQQSKSTGFLQTLAAIEA
ncbi:MAG: hypothetical protein ACFFFH_00270 [Candidatus Thorarchaeota archaeon]